MANFTDFFTHLRQHQDQAHRDRERFFRETRAGIQHAAQCLRNELSAFATDLKNGGRAFRGNG